MMTSYYERNREKVKEKAKGRYWKKREEIRAKQAAYREKHPDLNKRYYEENREYFRTYAGQRHRANPGRRYGLDADTYWKMVAEAAGACGVCGGEMKKICVDHDHKTGKVRGLVCHPCNVSLGLMQDDPARLERAATYLRNHAAR